MHKTGKKEEKLKALFKKYPVLCLYLIILSVLVVLDGVITFFYVSNGSAVEKNPLMHWLLQFGWIYFILMKMATLALVVFALLCAVEKKIPLPRIKKYALAAVILFVAFYGAGILVANFF